jgi:hypothetical protein
VVAHDAPSALVASAVRQCGAHAVWHLGVGVGSVASVSEALEFVGRFSHCIDAYLLSWSECGARGEVRECAAAAMPSAGIVAAKEFPSSSQSDDLRRLAWRMTVAELIRTDRGEAVGGTLHPRPTIAAR